MPRVVVPLTVTKIDRTKPGEKLVKLSDGGGLALWIYPGGRRSWRFSYIRPADGKPDGLLFGEYPDLSLAQARERRDMARADLAQGFDPKLTDYRRRIAAASPTFQQVATEWYARWHDTVTPDYALQVWRMLEANVFGVLGPHEISKITSRMLVDALSPMESRGALVYLRRARSAIGLVFGYALARGLVDNNVAVGISKAFKVAPKRHFRALAPEDVGDLLAVLASPSLSLTGRMMLRWQLLTLARPGEAAAARWDEIDDGVWVVPAERMKRRRDHLVPLSNGALAVLEVMRPVSGHREFIFPGRSDPKSHMSAGTANMALKRAGVDTTAHGLRALASTTLHEQGFDSRVIEMALAHVDQNVTRAAYNRSEYLQQRAEMLEWWSAWLAGHEKTA